MTQAVERRPVRSKAEARERAEALVRRFGDTVPVEPERIAEALGVKVVAAPPTHSGLSGALIITEKGSPVILYNRNDPPARRRFTMAHELGHYLMHTSEGQVQVLFRDDRSSRGTSIREIQANAFAAALLMPEHAIRARVKKPITPIQSDEVDEFAEVFGVSSQAMGYRLIDLGLYEPNF